MQFLHTLFDLNNYKLYCYNITFMKGLTMDNETTKELINELKNINSNLRVHNQILTVLLKFALDSSSYKSKTTDEIKATAQKENEILNAIHESSK